MNSKVNLSRVYYHMTLLRQIVPCNVIQRSRFVNLSFSIVVIEGQIQSDLLTKTIILYILAMLFKEVVLLTILFQLLLLTI